MPSTTTASPTAREAAPDRGRGCHPSSSLESALLRQSVDGPRQPTFDKRCGPVGDAVVEPEVDVVCFDLSPAREHGLPRWALWAVERANRALPRVIRERGKRSASHLVGTTSHLFDKCRNRPRVIPARSLAVVGWLIRGTGRRPITRPSADSRRVTLSGCCSSGSAHGPRPIGEQAWRTQLGGVHRGERRVQSLV